MVMFDRLLYLKAKINYFALNFFILLYIDALS